MKKIFFCTICLLVILVIGGCNKNSTSDLDIEDEELKEVFIVTEEKIEQIMNEYDANGYSDATSLLNILFEEGDEERKVIKDIILEKEAEKYANKDDVGEENTGKVNGKISYEQTKQAMLE